MSWARKREKYTSTFLLEACCCGLLHLFVLVPCFKISCTTTVLIFHDSLTKTFSKKCYIFEQSKEVQQMSSIINWNFNFKSRSNYNTYTHTNRNASNDVNAMGPQDYFLFLKHSLIPHTSDVTDHWLLSRIWIFISKVSNARHWKVNWL